MKAKIPCRAFLLGSALFTPFTAFADSGNWNVNAAGNWSLGTNWSSNPTVPGTAPGDIIGLTNNINAARIVTLDTTSRTAGTLNIGDSDNTHGFTLAASGAAKLTFDKSSSGASLVETGSIADSISAPLTLADNLAVAAAGTLTLSGIIDESGGAKAITKSGGGLLILSGNNSYSGGFTLSTGSVQVGTGTYTGFGTGLLTIDGGQLQTFNNTAFTTGNDSLWNANFAVYRGITGVSTWTHNGDVTLGANVTVNSLNNGWTTIVNGVIGETGGSRSLTLTGNTLVFTLNGANTYSGGTTSSSVGININNGGGGGTSSAIGTGPLTITAGTINNTSGSPVTLSTNNAQNWNASITFTGSNPLNMGTGAVTMSNNRIVTVNGNTFTVGGAIGETGGARTLTKSGAGTLVLGGNNSYTGTTTVNAGTLALDYSAQDHTKLANAASLILGPATLSLNGGTHPEVVGSCTLNGAAFVTRPSGAATLSLGAITRSAGSTLDVPGGGVVLTSSGDANSVLVATAGAYATVNSGVDWAAKNADDTTIVGYSTVGTYSPTTPSALGGSGNNSDVASGVNTTLASGASTSTLRFNQNEARTITIGDLQTLTLTQGGILATPTVNPASGTTIINGGTLKPGSNNALQIIQNSPKGMTIDSIIADGTAASALTKGGSGTLTLSGNNSYTGQTYVTAGKLFINGDQTLSAGAVTVAANATLGGKGIIGGITTIAAGGKLEFDLSTAPGSHDKLELAATRVLAFSGASTLTITSSGGATTGIYTLATAPGGIAGSAPATLILPPGWVATTSKSGNDLVLNVTSTGGGNTFANWIAGFDVDGQIGVNDDFDNDNLGNALENLLGTSPEVFSQGLSTVSASGGNLVFRHTLSTTPASDLTGSYEWSVNLVDWNASGATASGTTVTFGTPAIITPGTPNLVEVTAVTGTPAPRIFARFKAVKMP